MILWGFVVTRPNIEAKINFFSVFTLNLLVLVSEVDAQNGETLKASYYGSLSQSTFYT